MKSYLGSNSSTITSYLNGPPMPDGSRNITLTRIAGSLHDDTRSLEQLIRDLMAVNKARCKPPLPFSEVRDIAKSIHNRPACVPSKGKPPEKILDFVSRHWMGVLAIGPWKGQGGGSEYKVYEALLDVAQHHGWITEHGNVCVSVSVRDLAMRAGVSHKACQGALKRLQKQKLVYRVPSVTKGTAGRLILRDVLKDLPQGVYSQSNKKPSPLSVHPLRELCSTLRRFRHGRGRITPTMVLHVRALLFFPEGATVSWISRALDRRPDNVRRTFKTLEERTIVEQAGEDRYRVTADLLSALLQALDEDGVPDVEMAQRRRDEDQRDAYNDYLRSKGLAEAESGRQRPQPMSVVVPFGDFAGEVYTPEGVQLDPQPALVRNLPSKGKDGIFRHGPDCACWMCNEEAPEWVLADEVAA